VQRAGQHLDVLGLGELLHGRRGRVGLVLELPALVPALEQLDRRAPAAPQVAERGGRRDPVQPRVIARVAAKRAAVAEREQQRLLRHVVGIGRAADDPARDRVHELAVARLERDPAGLGGQGAEIVHIVQRDR
jgi:hypothetical protein